MEKRWYEKLNWMQVGMFVMLAIAWFTTDRYTEFIYMFVGWLIGLAFTFVDCLIYIKRERRLGHYNADPGR